MIWLELVQSKANQSFLTHILNEDLRAVAAVVSKKDFLKICLTHPVSSQKLSGAKAPPFPTYFLNAFGKCQKMHLQVPWNASVIQDLAQANLD